MALDVLGDQARGVQVPVHVGTNNFGFRGGQKISNLDRRPAHVDSILDYGDRATRTSSSCAATPPAPRAAARAT